MKEGRVNFVREDSDVTGRTEVEDGLKGWSWDGSTCRVVGVVQDEQLLFCQFLFSAKFWLRRQKGKGKGKESK